MKISQTHKRFSDHLREPKVLTNPEDFLGPNWRDVINFWLYIDGLGEKERIKMNDNYRFLNYDLIESSDCAAMFAAMEVVGREVRNAAWFETHLYVFRSVTMELIAHHKLLEQNRTLLALQQCLKMD
jgi:hypothetical protein